jgi:hypothetical protein
MLLQAPVTEWLQHMQERIQAACSLSSILANDNSTFFICWHSEPLLTVDFLISWRLFSFSANVAIASAATYDLRTAWPCPKISS